MFVCSNCPAIVIDEECVGKIIESLSEATNICVYTDNDGKEYLSFDTIATFTDGTKGNVHIGKAYLHIKDIEIKVNTSTYVTTLKQSLMLQEVTCGCEDQVAYFTVTPIKEMTQAEIEKELRYKIEIVEK